MSHSVSDPGDLLHKIAWSIRNSQELPEILQASVTGIQQFLKVDRVKLYQFNEDGSGVVLAEACPGDRLPSLLGLHFPAADIPPTARQTFARIRQSAIPDVRQNQQILFPLDPNLSPYQNTVSSCHRSYLEAMGVRATLTLPLFESHILWGLVSIHHSQPRCFSPQEQQILQLAIDQIAIAITQAKLLERTRQTAQHEATIARITRLLDESLPWERLQHDILTEVVNALDGSGGRLYLRPKSDSEAAQLYSIGDGSLVSQLEELPEWNEGFTSYNPLTLDAFPHPAPRSLTACDWNEQPSLYFLRETFAETPVRSLLVVPLQYHSQCVGYLTLFRRGYNQEIWWAGRGDPDLRNQRPRQSFAAWREYHRDRARSWKSEERKLAHTLGVHLYIAVVQRRVSAMLYYQLSHDPLTNLPNRILFDEQLALALVESQQHGSTIAVGFLDLDRFKVINDSFGHHVGDRLLKTVTQRLLPCLQNGDSLARWGGDELVFLFGSQTCSTSIAQTAKQLLDQLRLPFNLDGRELYITASLGIALSPQDGRDAATLLKHADTAMDWAKQQGRNNYQLYSAEMSGSNADRLALEIDLGKAISNQEFCLHYQPQIDLGSSKIVGVEALIRWEHPKRGRVRPDLFIPIAEETGAIEVIGEWVLRTACQQHRDWIEAGFAPVKMAVNLSARQFQQPNLVQNIIAILEDTQMPPSYLELEITETTAVKNLDLTIGVLRQLRDMGIQIAMDDFGTGYSCLSFIKQFPLDTLKIDRSFVRDLTRDSSDAAIAKTIVALGRGLNLIVLAEGVESHEQVEFLKTIHCDLAQGYLFSAPVPAPEILQLFRNWSIFHGIEKVPVRRTPAVFPASEARQTVLQRRVRELEDSNLQLHNDVNSLKDNLNLLHRHLQRERDLVHLSQAILAAQPKTEIFQTALAYIRRELNIDRAILYRYDADGNTLPLAVESYSRCAPNLPAPDLHSLMQTASPEVIAFSDIDCAPLSADDIVVLSQHNVKACAVVPILYRERIWGAIALHQDLYARQWSPDVLQWLQQIADILARMDLYDDPGIRIFCTRDRLTQLPDRPSFERRLRHEWQRLASDGVPLTLVLGQLQGFGNGRRPEEFERRDRALQIVAEAWCTILTRTSRFIARIGETEFAVLLPALDIESGCAVANILEKRARADLNAYLNAISVTLRLGMATLVPQTDLNAIDLLQLARQALASSPKSAGDKIAVATPSDLQGSSRLQSLTTSDRHIENGRDSHA